jgi:hypothetical protein
LTHPVNEIVTGASVLVEDGLDAAGGERPGELAHLGPVLTVVAEEDRTLLSHVRSGKCLRR